MISVPPNDNRFSSNRHDNCKNKRHHASRINNTHFIYINDRPICALIIKKKVQGRFNQEDDQRSWKFELCDGYLEDRRVMTFLTPPLTLQHNSIFQDANFKSRAPNKSLTTALCSGCNYRLTMRSIIVQISDDGHRLYKTSLPYKNIWKRRKDEGIKE